MTKQEEDFMERIMDTNSRLRNDNHRMLIFIKALVDPEMYGFAVSAEVRHAANVFLKNKEQV